MCACPKASTQQHCLMLLNLKCVCVCMCVKAGSATACGGTAGVGPSWIVRSDRKDTKCSSGGYCSGLSGGSLGHV